MTIHCHKSSLRSSAAQWNLDALVWDFPKERRGGFLERIRELLGECGGER